MISPTKESVLSLQKRVSAAMGEIPCEMVLKGGKIINVFTQELVDGPIGIYGGRIVAVGALPEGAIGPDTVVKELDGAYVSPGFIEPHFHSGDTSLPPQALGATLLERGTTSLATDMAELYAMGGVPAVEWALSSAESSGLRVLYMLPLFQLRAEQIGSINYVAKLEDFEKMADWPQTIAVNEPPAKLVNIGDEAVLTIVDKLHAARKRFEGHGAGVTGTDLQAYMAAGSSSDHECIDIEDALHKLRLGYRIIMRDCAASRDLDVLVEILKTHPQSSRFFMVGSDDHQVKEFIQEGHIDNKLRKVIAYGIDPLIAVQLATINTAEYFGLADDIGSISPGKIADILIIDDLTQMKPSMVIAAGKVVAENGKYVGKLDRVDEVPDFLKARANFGKTFTAADFDIPAPIAEGSALVRVMKVTDETIISEMHEHDCKVSDGKILVDTNADVLKIAVLDRHHGSGDLGKGFVRGFGLKSGAVASTFYWQHFGLMVVGADEADMAASVKKIEEIGGAGIVVVKDGELLAALPLPVGGILGVGTPDKIYKEFMAFEAALRSLGGTLEHPFMAMAFASIPYIPRYGITDLGWWESSTNQLVDVVLSTAPATGK